MNRPWPLWSILALCLLAFAAGCRNKPSGSVTEGAEAADAGPESLPKTVKLSASVIADAKIKTAPATKEALSVTLNLPGEIAPDPDKTARISSPVAGRLEQVMFKEGAAVKVGDALAIVRVPELGKIKAAYAGVAAKAKAARTNAERSKALLEQRLTSEQAVADAQANADALDAEARSLADQLTAMGAGADGTGVQLVLRAPVAGTVVARDAIVGQPISSEQVIGTISDLSEVWFLGRVFEKDLETVRMGAPAEVRLNAYANERFPGTIENLGRQVDPVARTLTARVRLKNKDGLLRLGLFGAARVATLENEAHEPMIVVPRSAVADIGGKSIVFVRSATATDTFQLHEVMLGDTALGKVEIASGLKEGQAVVVDGVFTLKSVVMKASIAEDE